MRATTTRRTRLGCRVAKTRNIATPAEPLSPPIGAFDLRKMSRRAKSAGGLASELVCTIKEMQRST